MNCYQDLKVSSQVAQQTICSSGFLEISSRGVRRILIGLDMCKNYSSISFGKFKCLTVTMLWSDFSPPLFHMGRFYIHILLKLSFHENFRDLYFIHFTTSGFVSSFFAIGSLNIYCWQKEVSVSNPATWPSVVFADHWNLASPIHGISRCF